VAEGALPVILLQSEVLRPGRLMASGVGRSARRPMPMSALEAFGRPPVARVGERGRLVDCWLDRHRGVA
jgi:hypothetical protein